MAVRGAGAARAAAERAGGAGASGEAEASRDALTVELDGAVAAAELQRQQQAIMAPLTEAREALAALASRREALASALDEQQQRAGGLRDAAAGHPDALAAVDGKLEQLAARIADGRARTVDPAERASLRAALEEAQAHASLLAELSQAAVDFVPELQDRSEQADLEQVDADEQLDFAKADAERRHDALRSLQDELAPLLEEKGQLAEAIEEALAGPRRLRLELDAARAELRKLAVRRRKLRPQLDERYGWLKQLRMEGGHLARRFPDMGRRVAQQRKRISAAKALVEDAGQREPLFEAVRERNNAGARANASAQRLAALQGRRDQLREHQQRCDAHMADIEDDWELCQRRVRVRTRRLAKVQAGIDELREELGPLAPSPYEQLTASGNVPAPPPVPQVAPPPPPPPIVPQRIEDSTDVVERGGGPAYPFEED